ncbi:MAG: SDR family oxidoreductase [Candidatus Micrarchaeaceae archaeon]
MEKTLIIGGSGLLSSKLLDLFDDAYFTYNATRIERKNAYQLDITDNDALKFLLEKINPKTVIVTAALTDVDKCEVNPELAYKINVVPFHYIIDYLKKVNGKLIQISTDYVFSGNEGNYRENDNRKPINVYGKTKMNAEDIIMNSNIDYTIIRTSGIFGLNQATGKTNFFLWIYNSLKDNKEIYLVRDQYYSPTFNTILANAVREITDRDLSGIIHFSSKDRITRYDFGILVADIFNLEKTLIHETIMENMKWIARRPRDSSLNNEKAIKLFNNKPINVIDELKLAKEKMREQSI